MACRAVRTSREQPGLSGRLFGLPKPLVRKRQIGMIRHIRSMDTLLRLWLNRTSPERNGYRNWTTFCGALRENQLDWAGSDRKFKPAIELKPKLCHRA
jgi:hypothetical protein